MLGALVSGGLSLVSGLFGRSDAKKKAKAEAAAYAAQKAEAKAAADVAMATPLIRDTSTTNSLDLKGLVAMAQANGFNPMSIINAGGLSAFTSTNTSEFTMGHNATAGLQAVLGVGAAPTANIPSVGSIVAGALSDGYQQYRSDARDNAQRASQAAGYFPPAPVPSFSDILRGGGTLTSSTGQRSVGNSLYEQKQASQTQSMPWLLDTDPNFADAESVETEYGDNWLVSVPYSITKLGANIANTVWNKTGYTQAERHSWYADLFNSTVSKAYSTLSNIGQALPATVPATVPATRSFGGRKGQNNYGGGW